MTFKIAEPTLGPEVGKLLESFLGCRIASEGILSSGGKFDFFLLLDDYKIVIELKVGGADKLPVAISQGETYKETVKADGIIAIVYTEDVRKAVTRPEDVRDIALQYETNVMVLCPFLKDYYPKIFLSDLANIIKESLTKPRVAPSTNLVVQTLRQAVQGISLEIKRNIGIDHPVVKETVGSFQLFEILSNETEDSADTDATRANVADLASYVLVNQILLHHILSKNIKLPKRIDCVSSPIELNAYFKDVTDIDYKAVYCIDVASNVPPIVTNEVNICILAIRAIEPENLSHDLLGRIFHEFLPQETRKLLGTFYTRPQAAEILARIAIRSAANKIIDPACGSGTLLVAGYQAKKAMGNRRHSKMVEDEITGIDVMPFAAHLAALNLTMQSPKERTNKTRIGVGNSLNMAVGDGVGNLPAWLREFDKGISSVDDEPHGDTFKIEPSDVVIMNPPFTRKESLTSEMKGIRFQSMGNQNFWAYFIPLADSLLKGNGLIAAVLPRDFFRGDYSKTVREFLFAKPSYNLRYIIKSLKDTAFSENARFRDFLIVVQKGASKKPCAFVYIKKRINDLTISESDNIADKIKSVAEGVNYEDEYIRMVWKPQEPILSAWKDLGRLVVFNTSDGDNLLDFYEEIITRKHVISISKSKPSITILRGVEPPTENLLNLIFAVRPIQKERLERASIIINSEEGDKIECITKNSKSTFNIPNNAVRKGLKTPAYIPVLDIEKSSDLCIIKSFEGFKNLQRMLKVKAVDFDNLAKKFEDRSSHLVVSRRINIIAPGTKLIAFYSKDKIIPGKAFWTFNTDITTSKYLSIWFNSTFAFIELLLSQTETEGSFIELTKEYLLDFHVPDLQKCKTAFLDDAFESIHFEEVPSLFEQFQNPSSFRYKIDTAVLRTLNYNNKDTDSLLRELYKSVATEMQSLLELMQRTDKVKTKKHQQMHLSL